MTDATTQSAPVEDATDRSVVAGPERSDGSSSPSRPDADALVEADLLVEDVSIDGMCGVY